MELHLESTKESSEKVVAGRVNGLFEKGDTVTWKAKHFGVYQELEMHLTEMRFPNFFEDKMLRGIFKSICHRHYFEEVENITTMRDEFSYEVPFGILGRMFNHLLLKKYMTYLLQSRNTVIKEFAESGKWEQLISALR